MAGRLDCCSPGKAPEYPASVGLHDPAHRRLRRFPRPQGRWTPRPQSPLGGHTERLRHRHRRRQTSVYPFRLTCGESGAGGLKENPDLKSSLSDYLVEAYEDAILETIKQTPFEETDFPVECTFDLNQILDDDFWPN